jgi:alkylation response protein AidB-like acyl-CoA dehydrogenase
LAKIDIATARRDNDALLMQQPATSEAARLLAAVRALTPEIAARAAEIEAIRRVPHDIMDRLRQLGLYRTLLPRRYGGFELSVPEIVPMLETLAAADASVGWVAMIGVGAQKFCARLPSALFEQIYRCDSEAPLLVGVGIPAGRAEITNAGYRVSGRWPFASACQNAQWMGALCVVCEDGAPVVTEQGPQTIFVILPAERWCIDETWETVGLAGTGSHHIVLDNAEVPAAFALDLFRGPVAIPGPFAGAVEPFNASFHGAIATGIATGAIADLVSLASSGRRQLFAAADLRDSPVFQHEVGRLDATLRAARALLQMLSEDHWRRALAGTLDGKADFAEALQCSTWIHTACTEVVSGCYTLGGSSSVIHTSSLQRRLRDIHTTRQHAFAQERFYAMAGRTMLGFPPVNPVSGK